MRMFMMMTFVMGVASTAVAAPKYGLELNNAKLVEDHKQASAELSRDFSPEAVAGKRALLLRGHTGYVYGDAGSVMNNVRDVDALAKQVGAKPVSKALANRVSQSGLIVSLQHEMVDAVHHRQSAPYLLPISLNYAIESATQLKMTGPEIKTMLNAYGFTKSDVEKYSKYKLE